MADAETQAANDAIRDQAAASREDKKDDKPDPPKVEVEVKDDTLDEIVKQADKPDAVRRAIQAEREEAKKAREQVDELAKKVKAFEDRDKSEQEKLEERASTAETKAQELEAKLLRLEVANEKGLPADLLSGSTKKELEQSAERLLEFAKQKDKPSGDVDAGKGEGGEGQTFNDQLRRVAGVPT